ncbi:MAG: methylmalonyl-CoA carboxyltransferase [Gammaproteobacteria bacterium]|nr:methylmalonyl-CoA carboxyltransferase [Gammaproteobacteria bacterium]
MAFDDLLSELDSRRETALGMGGAEKLARRRERGLLNARERLERLLDDGAFFESGLFATSNRAEVAHKTPADGKIAGFGRVDGRPIGVISNDFTVLGASSAVINGKKIRHVKETATRRGMPLVMLGESSGARMPDRMGAAGRAILGQDRYEYRRLRETPWVSALLGPCYGSSTWYSCLSDFVVMRKGALMSVASPRVSELAISQPVDPEELGGWRLHTEVTGLVDLAVDTDEAAVDAIKQFLSYLPSHQNEPPPVHEVPQGSGDDAARVLEILPESRTKVYDVRKIIAAIVDRDSSFELKPRFGRSVATVLTRMNGRTVGFLANNPLSKGGAIDVDACRKVTSFMVLCDSFNIPIVLLVDQPGFLIGLDGEKRWAPGRIMNWMNALSLVTVPKIALTLRKNYGQAYLNMGGGRNADENAAWPSADFGFMDPAVGVNVLHGLRREDDPERFDALVREIAQDSSPWSLAALYEAQNVIDPRDTRGFLIDALDVHLDRYRNGVGEHLLSNWPTSF